MKESIRKGYSLPHMKSIRKGFTILGVSCVYPAVA